MRQLEHMPWMEDHGIHRVYDCKAYALLDKNTGLIQAASHEPDAENMLRWLQENVDKSVKLDDFELVEILGASVDIPF